MDIALSLPIFEALGHETRLKVFSFIYRSGKIGVKPKEIINQFGCDSGTLDFHLKKLMTVGLISLKAGCNRGTYCVNDCIPSELLQLFDAMHTDGGLMVHPPPATLDQSELGALH
jgi:predicted transcriptional regulator